jgi:hypothetical protein
MSKIPIKSVVHVSQRSMALKVVSRKTILFVSCVKKIKFGAKKVFTGYFFIFLTRDIKIFFSVKLGVRTYKYQVMHANFLSVYFKIVFLMAGAYARETKVNFRIFLSF